MPEFGKWLNDVGSDIWRRQPTRSDPEVVSDPASLKKKDLASIKSEEPLHYSIGLEPRSDGFRHLDVIMPFVQGELSGLRAVD